MHVFSSAVMPAEQMGDSTEAEDSYSKEEGIHKDAERHHTAEETGKNYASELQDCQEKESRSQPQVSLLTRSKISSLVTAANEIQCALRFVHNQLPE